MKALILAVVALGLWAAGCSFPEASKPAPPSGEALPPPQGVAEPAVESGAAAGGSGAVIESIPAEPSATAGPTAITIPEGAGWANPGVPLTKQQQDTEACFSYADGQIARESQIDEDRYQGSDDREFVDQFGVTTLTRRLDFYSERRRRGALFDSCMESKGYVRN